MREIDKVEMYLERIVYLIKRCPSEANILNDIGIIAPYRKQVSKLKDACEKFKEDLNIEIGSIEQFQGKEKSVIILTTVRSHTNNVGFLNNQKRFNVAITRAKCLMIVIGNPKTLALDSYWGELVKYCEENRSRIGPKNERY
jgi:helicase MOV-10